jgi:pyruvate/2-oxoglutarate dehydrogenase complex dihydrolipoamide dehydrogenase (E3) component
VARTDYDLVIIGAGAAGLIAARFAVQLGARVAGRARSHWWRLHVDRLRAEQVADSSGEGGSRDSNRPALGATPVMPDIPGLKETPHCTYHNIFDLSHLPASLTVVGGGPLGMELAQAFQRLGSQVTMLTPRLLPHDDPDAADVLQRVFEREGVRWLRGRAIGVRQEVHRIVVASDAGGEAEAETILVAAGRRPNVEDLGLDRAGVAHSGQGISVDDQLRTNVPHIYAAGDVLGREHFSHVAGWQAFEATRNALLPGTASGRVNPMAH